ncbi:MAG: hypothetical protein QM719_05725 [Thermomonas sp.]
MTELDEYRASFIPAYDLVVARLRGPLKYAVTGRPAKSTTALVDKLNRQHVRLSQVQDIAGCRIVVEDIVLQDQAVRALDVFIDNPKVYDRRKTSSNGYRAVHLVADIEGRKVEVQVRTKFQHLWAEISEKVSDTMGPDLKYGVGDPEALSFLNNLSVAILKVEQEEVARDQVQRQIKSAVHIPGKIKRELRVIEKRFFARRSQLVQLLSDVHNDFSKAA